MHSGDEFGSPGGNVLDLFNIWDFLLDFHMNAVGGKEHVSHDSWEKEGCEELFCD